jgi:hypothetical protein
VWTLLSALPARADTCSAYGAPIEVVVEDAPVEESSGLAASRSRPGVYFTHDDAGGDPVLYAVDADGRYLGSHLVRGAENVDWEDVAAGPCPRDGEPCLYVADIGDNDAVRAEVTVYVVREPALDDPDVPRLETWETSYPDGAQDAETLLVHPCTGDVRVVTKGPDGTGSVYALPADRKGALRHVADLALDDDTSITGGSWDVDGDRLVLRTREQLFEWGTSPDDPDAHWGTAPALVAAVDEVQGEGVAFAPGGSIVTSDEGQPLRLHVLPCDDLVAASGECAFTPLGGCACGTRGPRPAALAAALALGFVLGRRR